MNKIYLAIKDNEMKAIPLSSILTIEAEDHYVSIYYKYDGKIKNLFAYAKNKRFCTYFTWRIRKGRAISNNKYRTGLMCRWRHGKICKCTFFALENENRCKIFL